MRNPLRSDKSAVPLAAITGASRWTRAFHILCLGALLLSGVAQAQTGKPAAPVVKPFSAAASAASQPANSASKPKDVPPVAPTASAVSAPPAQIGSVVCAFVYQRGAASSHATTEQGCQTHPAGKLEGTGDVVVVVAKKTWDQLVVVAAQQGERPRMFINGIAATEPTDLVSVDDQADGTVQVRFHIGSNKTAKALWTALYREGGLVGEGAPLRAALGWGTTPTVLAPVAPASGASAPSLPKIYVTTDTLRTWAFGAIIFMAVTLLAGLAFSDTFRDGPKVNGKLATFSLARVQMGLWLFFLIASAVFIGLTLQDLPVPETSVIALLGVTAATTGVSLAVDQGATNRAVQPSSGNIVSDMVTSWDGTQQLHRVQALAVNLLLLIVGITKVVEDLSYPVFDSGWLALLGISGATQTLFKQQLEGKPAVAAAPSPAVASGGATPPPAGQGAGGGTPPTPPPSAGDLKALPPSAPMPSGRSI